MIGIKINFCQKIKNVVDKIFNVYYNLFTLKPYLFKERKVIKDWEPYSLRTTEGIFKKYACFFYKMSRTRSEKNFKISLQNILKYDKLL